MINFDALKEDLRQVRIYNTRVASRSDKLDAKRAEADSLFEQSKNAKDHAELADITKRLNRANAALGLMDNKGGEDLEHLAEALNALVSDAQAALEKVQTP